MEVRVRQISVVICAYTEKRWDDLNAAVDSVIKQSHPASDIVLVIDHNPALFERAQKAFAHLSTERTKVVITQNTQLRGLSGARNTGIEQSCGDIVAFIDEDAMAAPDWLARMSAAYDDPNIMAAGGSIAPLWLTGKPSWFPDEFNWVVGCTYRGMPESRTPIRNLIGCNMSVRREVFDAVGGFRSGIGRVGTLPVGCEETELCIRAKQHLPNRTIMYDPAIRVFNHRVPGTRATWHYFYSRCYAEGISKALVSRFVGQRDGLASEMQYTLKTLPMGFARGFGDVLLKRDVSGVGRSVAIASGLLSTVAGFGVGFASVVLRFATVHTDTITQQPA